MLSDSSSSLSTEEATSENGMRHDHVDCTHTCLLLFLHVHIVLHVCSSRRMILRGIYTNITMFDTLIGKYDSLLDELPGPKQSSKKGQKLANSRSSDASDLQQAAMSTHERVAVRG